jgi:hypothetical protein
MLLAKTAKTELSYGLSDIYNLDSKANFDGVQSWQKTARTGAKTAKTDIFATLHHYRNQAIEGRWNGQDWLWKV